jgi:hypothetical protein
MITYDWQFLSCEVIPNLDTLENVVKKVEWRLLVSDGINSLSVDGITELSDPKTKVNFIEFSQLTKETVQDWVITHWPEYPDVTASLANQLMVMSKPQTVKMNFLFT